jgi:hypothetical protein
MLNYNHDVIAPAFSQWVELYMQAAPGSRAVAAKQSPHYSGEFFLSARNDF